ncbi:MAG: AraC family transcriptional regulator [Balneolales bacterium]|nr:AraC family transcriptional regulator [Balneolales bacterium]
MFLNTVFLLGAIHGVVLAIVLATKKVNALSNRILGGLMLVFSVDLAMAALMGSGNYRDYSFLIGIDYPITLLYAPLLFLYTETLIKGTQRLRGRELVHFIPFFLLFVFTIPFFLLSPEQKIANTGEFGAMNYGPEFVTHLKVGFNLLYIPFILRQLQRYQQQVKESYSSIEKRNLDWLRGFIYAFLVLALVATIIHFLNVMAGTMDQYSGIMLLAVTIFVYSIGYLGLRQAEFFSNYEETSSSAEVKSLRNVSYSKSGLSDERGEELMQELKYLMETEKPFINNELSLRDLSQMMGITSHNLTEIINRFAGRNFYDFVNGYRVEEVKSRINQPESSNLTLLTLGLEAGFNSKSSFNSVFKKHTGMTPTQYKKSLVI